MKFILTVLFALGLFSSCTKTIVEPISTKIVTDTIVKTKIDTLVKVKIVTDTVKVSPNAAFLIGSWQIVTVDGIDATFDIVGDANAIYTTNAKVTYSGITSSPATYNTRVLYRTSTNSYDVTLWSTIPFASTADPVVNNAATFYGLRLNPTNTQLTTSLSNSFVSVTGYDGTLNNNIIYISSAIVINKVK